MDHVLWNIFYERGHKSIRLIFFSNFKGRTRDTGTPNGTIHGETSCPVHSNIQTFWLDFQNFSSPETDQFWSVNP